MHLTKQTRRTLLIGVVLSAVTLAVYWPVTGHDFISCDDPAYVTVNAHVLNGLNWENVGWAFGTNFQANWHPVTWLSHMLDVQLFGVKPGWHHLTSLLFHAANAVLLFLLLQGMTGAAWRSALVAALFALHPLHVESVAWAAERKDVLSGFFFMLTLLAYYQYVQSPKSKVQSREAGDGEQLSVISNQSSVVSSQNVATRNTQHAPDIKQHATLFYLLALFLFALGLLSKPMLVTLPFLLLLLDYWPLQRLRLSTLNSQLSTFLEKLPFLALAAASCVVTLWAQSAGGAVASLARVSLEQRVGNALVAYATYLGQTFWPSDLAMFYPLRGQLPPETLALSVVVLLGITAWAMVPPVLLWRRGLGRGGPSTPLLSVTASSPCPSPPEEERETAPSSSVVVAKGYARPYLVVGWLWFLGMLVPVIGLVQVGTQEMADRYTYLPLIGIFIMLVWGVSEALERWQIRRPKSEGRKNPETRSSNESASASENAAPPDVREAPSDFGLRPSFGFRPSGFGFPQAALAGLALLACAALTSRQLSWWQDTERLFLHALAVTRDNYMAHNNLAGNYYLEGKLDAAIDHYQASLAAQPLQTPYLEIHYYLGEAMNRRGRYAEAAEHLAAVLKEHPNDLATLVQLGIARARQGQTPEAVQAFSDALRLDPNDAAAHTGFGNMLAQQGRHEEAVRQFEEAVRLKPDNASALNNLAISCKKLGRIGEAIAHYREAIRLQPDSLEALNNLAWILAAHPEAKFRNGAEAVELATRACELTKYQNPIPLVTVAAAYGEAGKLPEAISFAEQAQALVAGSNPAVDARLKAMLEAFRAGHAYRGE